MNLPFKIDLEGKVAVVTGGSGVLGSVMARALAACGARVVIIARSQENIDRIVNTITEEGGEALGLSVNVLKKEELLRARKIIQEKFGPCDILINGAGGNHPEATTGQEYFKKGDTSENKNFFDLDTNAISEPF